MFKRLRKSVLKRWAALTWRHNFRVVERENVLWLLDHRNFVDRQLGVFGRFEPEQRTYLFSLMGARADVFLDIGANFGLYTLQAAYLNVAARICAFEPDPRNRAQLFANLYLNRVTERVEVYQHALSDTDGVVSMHLHPETTTGTSRVSPSEGNGTNVSCARLDTLMDIQGLRVLVKMDIEGHELHALQGMTSLLTRNSCVLQIEVFERNRAAVADFMTAHGYEEINRIGEDSYYVRAKAIPR